MTKVSEHDQDILKDLDEPVPTSLYLSRFFNCQDSEILKAKGSEEEKGQDGR